MSLQCLSPVAQVLGDGALESFVLALRDDKPGRALLPSQLRQPVCPLAREEVPDRPRSWPPPEL